jgi:hypothetical protein
MATAEQDKKTPVFDYEVGEFVTIAGGSVVSTAKGPQALPHIIAKTLCTERGKYLIYTNVDDVKNNQKYGTDVPVITKSDISNAAKVSEVKRTVKEAIQYDPWIKNVINIDLFQLNESIYTITQLETIFDKDTLIGGVKVNV